MYRYLFALVILTIAATSTCKAQFNDKLSDQFNEITPDGEINSIDGRRSNRRGADSLGTDKEIPVGLRVWSIEPRLGFIRKATPDTLSNMFMNTVFTEGLRGEYNTTGNVGTARINRIFIDRKAYEQFAFTSPYDYFITPVENFHFTNTLSPFTNVGYNTCGDRTEGEDHLVAKFGVNAGKRLGMGMKFNYIYGRGFYDRQGTSLFNTTLFGSYLGDRYQAHLLMSINRMKITENGGIADDNYITHPESFADSYEPSEVPVVLQKNWNRNKNQHIYLTHRYNLGFNRKVPMTKEEIDARKFAIAAKKDAEKRKKDASRQKENTRDSERRSSVRRNEDDEVSTGRPDDAHVIGIDEQKADTTSLEDRISVASKAVGDSILSAQKKAEEDTSWLKNEYVPVTSFIHTVSFDNYKRIYLAYDTPTYDAPAQYYLNTYNILGYSDGDNKYIFDCTRHYALRNTFAVSMLEGFNKWAKAGLNVFLTSEMRHFELPDTIGYGRSNYNEHNLSIGAQLIKHQGRTFHYELTAETWITGEDAGQMKLDATTDVNFKLLGDTVTLSAKGFVYRLNPTFYQRHYHSRHFWWDNDLDKIFHTRAEGSLNYKKTNTTLRVAVDEIKNYTYLGQSYIIGDEKTPRTATSVMARQCGDAINLITISLTQDFRLGPLNWQNVITYQKSSKDEVLVVPKLNIYSNLFLRFKIAKVLSCDLGADMRYFTSYYAPDYSPALGQYTVQEGADKVKTGGYPFVNVYANFHLKRTRFFLMMSHVNSDIGKNNYFMSPHYPVNPRTIRFGLSWNFIN